MQYLLTSRSQMWLLPFLAVAVVKAQVNFGVSGGPQLVFFTSKFGGLKETATGFGLFGGGSLTYEVADKILIGGDLLISWNRYTTKETEFDSTYDWFSGRLESVDRIDYKYTNSDVFIKLPVTVRYLAETRNLTFELGAGLQPYLWVASSSSSSTTKQRVYPSAGTPITTTTSYNNFSDPLASAFYNKFGVSAVLMAGVRFSQLSLYLRLDPQLSSLTDLVKTTQTTLGVMATYWFGQ